MKQAFQSLALVSAAVLGLSGQLSGHNKNTNRTPANTMFTSAPGDRMRADDSGSSVATSATQAAPGARSQNVDQRQIVFASERDGNWEIYVMNPDGSNQRRLTHSKGRDVQNRLPNWCGPGKKITFVSSRARLTRRAESRGGAAVGFDLYMMNADGSNVQRFTRFDKGSTSFPACSPDGSRISYVSTHEGLRELYLTDAAGSAAHRLTENGGEEELSVWSPDGKTIAFDAAQDGRYEIYVIEVEGTTLHRLTRAADRGTGNESPDWSPDGKTIVFHSDREGKREIYAMDIDGSNLRRLTRTPGADTVSTNPNWSPSGRQIAFVSDRDGNREIYVMDSDGSNVQRLTFTAGHEAHPDW